MEREGPTAEEEEPNQPQREPQSETRWRRFVTRAVPSLTVAVIGGVILVNLISVDQPASTRSAGPSPPVRGAACPDLQQAARQLEAGNDSGFVKSVQAAARAGEVALQRSGETFGRPEKLALELTSMLEAGASVRNARVDRLMSRIGAACRELDRWQ